MLLFFFKGTNKRTDCQLLTICHHWQTVGPTELISLLFTLLPYFLLVQPIIIPHSNTHGIATLIFIFLIIIIFIFLLRFVLGVLPADFAVVRLVSPYEAAASR